VTLCGYTPVEFARPQVTSTMSLLPVISQAGDYKFLYLKENYAPIQAPSRKYPH